MRRAQLNSIESTFVFSCPRFAQVYVATPYRIEMFDSCCVFDSPPMSLPAALLNGQPIHEEIEEAICLRALMRLACDSENTQKACCDILGADI
jgi:hypothetical protein